MNLTKKCKKVSVSLMTILISSTMYNKVFASGIGTAEVATATENIKRVIMSIAMPLRWSFNIRKCSYCSIKNDY